MDTVSRSLGNDTKKENVGLGVRDGSDWCKIVIFYASDTVPKLSMRLNAYPLFHSKDNPFTYHFRKFQTLEIAQLNCLEITGDSIGT